MALKRGKYTNYTYQGFALVDETYFPHGGCFSNRNFVRETPDLVTYIHALEGSAEYDLVQTQN
jgi:hypothetical protein